MLEIPLEKSEEFSGSTVPCTTAKAQEQRLRRSDCRSLRERESWSKRVTNYCGSKIVTGCAYLLLYLEMTSELALGFAHVNEGTTSSLASLLCSVRAVFWQLPSPLSELSKFTVFICDLVSPL